mmetsp:Transcript_22206/g.68675  ORF Transcript_22206/g.68675 Transcript_22206/m.68675 type:complete len:230 (-) Transcript_22206:198-887(-)
MATREWLGVPSPKVSLVPSRSPPRAHMTKTGRSLSPSHASSTSSTNDGLMVVPSEKKRKAKLLLAASAAGLRPEAPTALRASSVKSGTESAPAKSRCSAAYADSLRTSSSTGTPAGGPLASYERHMPSRMKRSTRSRGTDVTPPVSLRLFRASSHGRTVTRRARAAARRAVRAHLARGVAWAAACMEPAYTGARGVFALLPRGSCTEARCRSAWCTRRVGAHAPCSPPV